MRLLGRPPRLFGQFLHLLMIAADGIKGKLAAQRCEQGARVSQPFATNACPFEGYPGFRTGKTMDGDQWRAERDLYGQFLPIAFGALRKQLECFERSSEVPDGF